ncbi:MAG: POTRA domain-containing protein [Desulfobacterales bacterium]
MVSVILAILIIQMTVATDCRAAAEDKPPVIIHVVVEGNQRIEDDAILRVTRAKTGDPYDEALLSGDLEAIYKMGWFDDVRVAVEPSAQGNTVIFTVQEKPTIREIRFSGNVAVDDDTLKENVIISSGSILNIFIVRRNMKINESLYKDKNYHNVEVAFDVEPLENNQANLSFTIEEGKKGALKRSLTATAL